MKSPTNIGASVRHKLLLYSRSRGDDHTLVLTRYAIERLLYRLSVSPHRDRFVLKGAALYAIWQEESDEVSYRPTRDLDFWSSGAPDIELIIDILREILVAPAEDDGLMFDLATTTGDAKRVNENYQGCNIKTSATLDGARIPISIDFGFGDAITPAPRIVDYPTILDTSPAPSLSIYPRETVVAEKFEAMVDLDMINGRLKDFYDIWMLSQNFDFEGPVLCEALRRTFARRQTALPFEVPTALTERFSGDSTKLAQWKSFGKRIRASDLLSLSEVTEQLQTFLWPVVQGIHSTNFEKQWTPQNGWQTTKLAK